MNTISLIVATAKNNAIGKDNELLWRIKDDLKLFRRTTSGHVVIHGRKSFESIGKPLPNRTNIVITRDTNYIAQGAFVVHSLKDAIELGQILEQKNEVFILGGAQIYQQSLDNVTRMYISHVDASFEDADAFFPDIDLSNWNVIEEASYLQSDVNQFGFEFKVYSKD